MIEGGPFQPGRSESPSEKLPEQLRPIGEYFERLVADAQREWEEEGRDPREANPELTDAEAKDIMESHTDGAYDVAATASRLLGELTRGNYDGAEQFLEYHIRQNEAFVRQMEHDIDEYAEDTPSRHMMMQMLEEYKKETAMFRDFIERITQTREE